ncbi:hypothetical protein GW17_00009572 [Ensete ventricosum]|nr:hypothetical protein GW17_00009572 [Ensete ventricosum]
MPTVLNNVSLNGLPRLNRYLVYHGTSIMTAVINNTSLWWEGRGVLHDPHNPLLCLSHGRCGRNWVGESICHRHSNRDGGDLGHCRHRSFFNQKARRLASRIRELETSLAAALEKSASERRGRTKAQQVDVVDLIPSCSPADRMLTPWLPSALSGPASLPGAKVECTNFDLSIVDVGGPVRVPRLKGCKMGVLATRSPHRPCPIGLTVAKVM